MISSTAPAGLPHVFGELNQFLNHLRGFDGAVLVFMNGILQQFGKRLRLNQEFFGTDFDFVIEQLAQQFDGEIFLRHVSYFCQKLIRENRDIRLLKSRGCEDVDHLARNASDLSEKYNHLIGAGLARRVGCTPGDGGGGSVTKAAAALGLAQRRPAVSPDAPCFSFRAIAHVHAPWWLRAGRSRPASRACKLSPHQ